MPQDSCLPDGELRRLEWHRISGELLRDLRGGGGQTSLSLGSRLFILLTVDFRQIAVELLNAGRRGLGRCLADHEEDGQVEHKTPETAGQTQRRLDGGNILGQDHHGHAGDEATDSAHLGSTLPVQRTDQGGQDLQAAAQGDGNDGGDEGTGELAQEQCNGADDNDEHLTGKECLLVADLRLHTLIEVHGEDGGGGVELGVGGGHGGGQSAGHHETHQNGRSVLSQHHGHHLVRLLQTGHIHYAGEGDDHDGYIEEDEVNGSGDRQPLERLGVLHSEETLEGGGIDGDTEQGDEGGHVGGPVFHGDEHLFGELGSHGLHEIAPTHAAAGAYQHHAAGDPDHDDHENALNGVGPGNGFEAAQQDVADDDSVQNHAAHEIGDAAFGDGLKNDTAGSDLRLQIGDQEDEADDGHQIAQRLALIVVAQQLALRHIVILLAQIPGGTADDVDHQGTHHAGGKGGEKLDAGGVHLTGGTDEGEAGVEGSHIGEEGNEGAQRAVTHEIVGQRSLTLGAGENAHSQHNSAINCNNDKNDLPVSHCYFLLPLDHKIYLLQNHSPKYDNHKSDLLYNLALYHILCLL